MNSENESIIRKPDEIIKEKLIYDNIDEDDDELKLAWRISENEYYENNLLDDILSETQIPKNFDILSIDVDGIDYAIWRDFTKYSPKIVVIEINSGLDPVLLYGEKELTKEILTTRSGINFRTCYELAKNKNYSLVCHTGNMIFIHNDYKKFVECYNDENYLEAFDSSWRI